eukprot:4213889-Lingulodinium_polyedra.AAC.1
MPGRGRPRPRATPENKAHTARSNALRRAPEAEAPARWANCPNSRQRWRICSASHHPLRPAWAIIAT